MRCQRCEYRIFGGAQRDELFAARELAGGQIQRKGAETDTAVALRRGHGAGHLLAAQHGVQAGEQFARVEGLGQVVVGAHFQAHDAVDRIALGGKHQDRDGLSPYTQAAADGQTVLARHHQVEDQRIERFARQQAIQLFCVLDAAHGQTVGAEIALQQGAQFRFVVQNDDLAFHDVLSSVS